MPFLSSTLKTTALVPSLGQHFTGFSEGFYDPFWPKAGAAPSLDQYFAADKNLTDRISGKQLITHTRAGGGTYIDSNRVLRNAAVNLLLQSEGFQNSPWVPTQSSITANAATSPSGSSNAAKFIATNTSGLHYIVQTIGGGVAGTFYTFSVYAKADALSSLKLDYTNGAFAVNQSVRFNLTNGTSQVTAGTPTASVTPLPNGWYRCSITAAPTGSGAYQVILVLSQAGVDSFTGDGTSGVYL